MCGLINKEIMKISHRILMTDELKVVVIGDTGIGKLTILLILSLIERIMQNY